MNEPSYSPAASSTVQTPAENVNPALIVMTRGLLDSLRTNGSFTAATLTALGLTPKNLVKGWASRLCGQSFSDSQIAAAKAGVGIYAKEFRRRKHALSVQPPAVPRFPRLDPNYSRSKYQSLLNSREWANMRYLVLRNRGKRCQLCGEHRTVLHVDHIVPASVNWSKRLSYTNLQVLCEACNLGKGNLYSDDWRPRNG